MKKIVSIMVAVALVILPCYAVYAEKIEFKQGIVKEVIPFYDAEEKPVDGSFFVWLQLSDNADDVVVFHVNEQTKFLNELELAAGAEVKASYDASLPVALIYPPRYGALSVEVLKEGADAPEEAADNSKIAVMVDGERVMGAFAYDDSGVLMVPVRAVFEQLMYPVEWDGELKQVRVGVGITMTIGEDEYNYARMTPFKLGKAPLIKDETTYVPLSFFTEVMRFAGERAPGGNITIVSTANR